MKFFTLLRALLLQLLLVPVHVLAGNVRAIFLYKDLRKSDINAIKSGGYNTAVIYGFRLLTTGNIVYTGSNTPGSSDLLVAAQGNYVGGDDLAARVRSLKQGSEIRRVEITIDAMMLRDLMKNPGTGPNLQFSRNLAALKQAWNLDAILHWDEIVYLYKPARDFGIMAGNLGFKFSLMTFHLDLLGGWYDLRYDINKNRPANDPTLDRFYVKCFNDSGGSYPPWWGKQLKQEMVPLLWTTNDAVPKYGNTPAQAKDKLIKWRNDGNWIGGGAFWRDHDIEAKGLSYQQYGQVLKELFP
ncbi:hypothetical protein VTJ49DRAFT_2763 [Mycothermus thermophilus]|uniref:Uncharacterized protein n=1 Tax=Humicola insolens TaxID=85995 RepID=A0ABR3VNJ2_HUMIN